MNDVIKLQLYRKGKDDVWFFDAPEHGLKAEPFVSTTNNIIDMAIEKAGKNLEQAKENGVTISFSFAKVPPQLNAVECHYVEGDHRWSLYKVVNEPDELSGWLCPSLWHYTPEENGAPPIISVWV